MQDTSRFIKLSAKHYTKITFFEKSDNMALIKCPECGREKVSDSALVCPECGFGIKEYFDNMRWQYEREEYQRIEEERRREAQRQEEELIKSVPPLKRPALFVPFAIIISAVLMVVGALRLESINEEFSEDYLGGLISMCAFLMIVYAMCLLIENIRLYKFSKNDFEAYQRYVIRKRKSKKGGMQVNAPIRPMCPYCHSNNTSKITATSKAVNTAMWGIYGQKRRYQWHCNNCNSDF